MSHSIWAVAIAFAINASPPASPVVDGDVARALDVILTRNEHAGFCGGMLLAKNGKILLSKGYGFADRAHKRPFTPETPFDIGSVTKQFTATGILHLAREKKLRLEDHLNQFFPSCPDDKKAVTLHHLLTHSAGMPDTFGDDYDVMTRQQFLDKALAAKLLWSPGTRYRYSNAGYSVLAAVIEIVSHEPYEAYLRRTLWLPAGMEPTGYSLPAWDKRQLAHGYDRKDKDWGTPLDHRWDKDGPYWNLKGNGGILSTLEDLYRWNRAMKTEQILPEEWKNVYPARLRGGELELPLWLRLGNHSDKERHAPDRPQRRQRHLLRRIPQLHR